MTAHARRTDPITSHEAAATVDTNRSQTAVLELIRRYMGDYFTHKGVVATYRTVQEQQARPAQEPGLRPVHWAQQPAGCRDHRWKRPGFAQRAQPKVSPQVPAVPMRGWQRSAGR